MISKESLSPIVRCASLIQIVDKVDSPTTHLQVARTTDDQRQVGLRSLCVQVLSQYA